MVCVVCLDFSGVVQINIAKSLISILFKDQFRGDNETCTQYITSPKYIQGAYRGYFSINDKSHFYTKPKRNEEYLDTISLVLFANKSSTSYDPINSPLNSYAQIFDSGK